MRHLNRRTSYSRTVFVCLLSAVYSLGLLPMQACAARKKTSDPKTDSAIQKNILPTYSAHLDHFQKVAQNVGIQVVSIPSGEVIWEYHPTDPLVPASAVKVLTSYTALKRLGPYHHFRTEIWADSGPQNGVIAGNIWVKGYGDPYFLGEKAWTLAHELKAHGVREIRGGVYMDNSYFSPGVEKICIDDRCHKPYNPVLSATALEFNTVAFQFFPGSKAGGSIQVEYYPEDDDQISMEGESPVVRSAGGASEYPGGQENQLAATDTYRCGTNAPDPEIYGSNAFRNLLEQAGISVGGPAGGAGVVPKGSKSLVSYQSPPLKDIIQGLNRHSNNFMAEMLVRVVGASLMSSPGTVEKGAAVIRDTLQNLGVPGEEVYLDSGSGLSRTCRVSARAFSAVLTDAYRDFSIAPEFLASLASNGHEGTLRKRMRGTPLTVRGKTGTLNNVIAFTGYVSDPESQKTYAATILLNEVTNRWEAKQAIDSFLLQLPRMMDEKADTPL